jgi:hypothetical protein
MMVMLRNDLNDVKYRKYQILSSVTEVRTYSRSTCTTPLPDVQYRTHESPKIVSRIHHEIPIIQRKKVIEDDGNTWNTLGTIFFGAR